MFELRVVIAPSGFKESLSAEEAAAAIAAGVRNAYTPAEIFELPLVDGGEGFTATLVNVTGGKLHRFRVTGPIGEPVDSHFGILGAAAKRAQPCGRWPPPPGCASLRSRSATRFTPPPTASEN